MDYSDVPDLLDIHSLEPCCHYHQHMTKTDGIIIGISHFDVDDIFENEFSLNDVNNVIDQFGSVDVYVNGCECGTGDHLVKVTIVSVANKIHPNNGQQYITACGCGVNLYSSRWFFASESTKFHFNFIRKF